MYQFENFIRLAAGAVIAGCWWVTAIRLQKHWILYAIAVLATIAPLLSSGMTLISQMMPNGRSSMAGISHIWTVVAITNAVLFILFSGWLIRTIRGTPPSPPPA